MFRLLLTLLTAFSLLLCIATSVLWVHGYWRVTKIQYRTVALEEFNEPGIFPPSFQDTQDYGLLVQPGALSFTSRPNGGSGMVGGFSTRHWPTDDIQITMTAIRMRAPSDNIHDRWELPGLTIAQGSYPNRDFWSRPDPPYWEVHVRSWLLASLTAILPLVMASRALARRRRIRAGHCRVCGYDLRATPDFCPECGLSQNRETKDRP